MWNKNIFLYLISYTISFIVSVYRSIKALIFGDKKIKKWIFFRSLDFLFRVWPIYFWKKPTFFKITSFFGMFIKYVFYNDKTNID